jgi:NAD-dependent SIR2 family protein deacetylase
VNLDAAPPPDGDADLDHLDFCEFAVPACGSCGGVQKPDVGFFGENVPRHQVAAAQAALEEADAMLVVGSSLMVYSGLRLFPIQSRPFFRRNISLRLSIVLSRMRSPSLLCPRLRPR